MTFIAVIFLTATAYVNFLSSEHHFITAAIWLFLYFPAYWLS